MAQLRSMSKMEEAVHHEIEALDLLKQGDRIVVAVSGGADSVALLACLVGLSAQWKWELSIGHVNHGLRGAESHEDATFVEKLGQHFDLPVCIRNVHLNKQDAKGLKQSFQAYARQARYHALEDILEERGATKIATAHTADDQAETVLMWMLRGSGTGGLSGIPPKRGERIIRPFLRVSRSEIERYLQQQQLSYRHDSSNSQPVYLRNRLRLDLMPHLKEYSPGIVKVLSRQAEIIRDDHAYLEHVAAEAFQQSCVIDADGILELDRSRLLVLPIAIQRRVVRQGIQKIRGQGQSLSFDIIQQSLDCLQHGQSGWAIQVKGISIGQEYDRLVFSKRERLKSQDASAPLMKGLEVNIPGEVVWSLTGQRVVMSRKHPVEMTSQPHSSEMHLDADTFTPELRLRSWLPGDVFCPKGFGGRQKKLQDFFADIKLPRSQRAKVPLLVAPEGILWVGGLREDERFQVSAATTSVVIATMSA